MGMLVTVLSSEMSCAAGSRHTRAYKNKYKPVIDLLVSKHYSE
jgi:hypothetical protein